MKRILAAWIVAALVMSAQESPDEKEQKKQEEQKATEAAKAALKKYTDSRKDDRKADDIIESIGILKEAKPHLLIQKELLSLLAGPLPPIVRREAAEGLREYKKDVGVCVALLRHARSERGTDKDVVDLRRRCLRSYGAISPFAKAVDLEILFNDPDHEVAREAVEAVEAIKSVRSLRSLLALLAELERIREDDGKDPGPEGPGELPKQQGDNNSKRKRKEVLLEPTKKALNSIWGKVDSKKTFKDYTEANRAVGDKRADIKKIQDEEDAADRKP